MTTILTGQFDEALVSQTHPPARQQGKGTDIPYISHPLAGTKLVIARG